MCNDTVDYIGETGREVRLRFNEHFNSIKNCTKETDPSKPLALHFREKHVNLVHKNMNVPISIEILSRPKDYVDRKLSESIFIRKLKPKLNQQKSSWRILPIRSEL